MGKGKKKYNERLIEFEECFPHHIIVEYWEKSKMIEFYDLSKITNY